MTTTTTATAQSIVMNTSNNRKLQQARPINTSSTTTTTTKHNIPCKYFSSGKCAYGKECRFLHIHQNGSNSGQSSNYNDTDDYFNDGHRRMDVDQFASTNEDDDDESYDNYAGHGYIIDSNDRERPFVDHDSMSDNDEYSFTSSNSSSGNGVIPHTTSLRKLQNELDHVSQVLLSRRPLLHIVVLFAGDSKVRAYLEEVQEMFLNAGINVYSQLTTNSHDAIRPENLQDIITSSTSDYLVVIGDRNMKHKTCHAKRSGKLHEMPVNERVSSILNEWSHNLSAKHTLLILEEDVEEITKDQLLDLVQLFAGIRNIKDRSTRLRTAVNELKDIKIPKGLREDSTLSDEKLLFKLTTTQNTAIRLHKDITLAHDTLQAIPVDNSNGANLPRGVLLNTVTRDRQQIGISSVLKEKMIAECEDFLPKVERIGAQLSEVLNNASLWEAYLVGHRERKKSHPVEVLDHNSHQPATKHTGNHSLKRRSDSLGPSWPCKQCTFENALSRVECEMCFAPRSYGSTEGEWVNTSKKGRRKQRDEEAIPQKQQTKSNVVNNRNSRSKSTGTNVENNQSKIQTNPWLSSPKSSINRNSGAIKPSSVPTILQKKRDIIPTATNYASVVTNGSIEEAKRIISKPEPVSLKYDEEYPSLNGVKKKKSQSSTPEPQSVPTVVAMNGNTVINNQNDILRQINNLRIGGNGTTSFQNPMSNSHNLFSTSQQQQQQQFLGSNQGYNISSIPSSQNTSLNTTPLSTPPVDSPTDNALPVQSSSDIWGFTPSSNFQPNNGYFMNNNVTTTNPTPNLFTSFSHIEQQPSTSSSPQIGSGFSQVSDPRFDNNRSAANIWNSDIGGGSMIQDQWLGYNPNARSFNIASAFSSPYAVSHNLPSSSLFPSPMTLQSNQYAQWSQQQQQQQMSVNAQNHMAASLRHLIETDGDDSSSPEPEDEETPLPPADMHDTSRAYVHQPCAVCGEESLLECNFCVNLRRKGFISEGTYFCSPEHQILAFQDHQKYHDQILAHYQ